MVSNWNEPALSNFQGESFIHAEVASEMAKLHLLYEKIGVTRGNRIALCGKNSARWAIAFLANQTYGAVSVPILNEFTPENVQNLTAHSESAIIFTEAKIWSGIDSSKLPQLKAAINISDYSPLFINECANTSGVEEGESNASAGIVGNGNIPEEHLPVKPEDYALVFRDLDNIFAHRYPNGIRPDMLNFYVGGLDDLAVINYSSGTTGSPKGIMLTSRNISANVEFALKTVPCQKGDTVLSMLPMAHMYGLAFEFMYTFCGGAHIYFLGRTPSPSILMRAFEEVKPYILITVPLVMEKIVKSRIMPVLNKTVVKVAKSIPLVDRVIYGQIHKKLLNAFGGNIREIDIGGAAISRPVEAILRKAGIPYTVGYGMTECAPLIGYSTPPRFVAGSCGRAVDGCQVRVDSTNGQKVVGELQVKGDNVMMGYYKNPESTNAAFTADGWLRTGDLGIIDKDGNIFIKGRSKCMILTSNGQNIYPEEIEDILKDMPYVNECLVIERNKQLIAIVAPVVEANSSMKSEDLLPIMENNRLELNKLMPAYSKIQHIELLEKGFEHTPKHSIKRHLYK